MRFFGVRYFSPAYEDAEHVDTPVGEPCAHCGEPIEQGDDGWMIPPGPKPFHRACFLRGIIEVRAQFYQREPRGVRALAAIRAVIVRVVDVRLGRGLELAVFHAPTLTLAGCGLLRYNSYSILGKRELYN